MSSKASEVSGANAHAAAACVAALFLASSVFAGTVALRLLLLALGIVLAAFAAARNPGSIRVLPPIWLAFALWAAWAAASLAWSIEPLRTLKELRNEVFYTGAALWVCFVAAQARHAERIVLSVLGAAAVSACAIALWLFARDWQAYQAGWHGGPGDHSSALVTLLPCVLMAGWYAWRRGRPSWVLAASAAFALLFLASAYTTLNRTVWLAFVVEVLVLGTLIGLRTRLSLTAGAVATAIVVGSAAAVLNVQAEREAMGIARELGQDARRALWPEVAERIAERPLTGYGFGRGLLRQSLQQELGRLDTNLWHAHNVFLDAMLQTGLIGSALLLALLVAILREAWAAAREPDDWTAVCGMALIGVVAGMLVRNMTDTLLVRQNALLFWGTVGALLALASRRWRA